MKSRRKTLFGMAVVLGAIIGLAAIAQAQGRWWQGSGRQGSGWPAPAWHRSDIPRDYQFSRKQARKLDEICGRYEQRFTSIGDQLASTQVQLNVVLSDPNRDEAKVDELQARMDTLESQAEQLQTEANAVALPLLSSAQRAYFGDAFDVLGMGCGWTGSGWSDRYCDGWGRGMGYGWCRGPAGRAWGDRSYGANHGCNWGRGCCW